MDTQGIVCDKNLHIRAQCIIFPADPDRSEQNHYIQFFTAIQDIERGFVSDFHDHVLKTHQEILPDLLMRIFLSSFVCRPYSSREISAA